MNNRPFRVLYREFLFRMVDRDLLSAHAQGDTSKLLGQFAAILILLSLCFSLLVVELGNKHVSQQSINVAAWGTEHSLLATTMLIVGLFAVLSWDSTFPDRRDVLVLSPLPVSASTIFLSKAATLGTALSITVAIFNAAPGFLLPLALLPPSYSPLDIILSPIVYRLLIAYWITMFAAGASFCAVC